MKLVKTDLYLLLIDDKAEIQIGDYFYDNDGEVCHYTKDYTVDPNKWSDNNRINGYYPLTKEAKELERLPLLPNPFEEDVNIEDIAFEVAVNKFGFRNNAYEKAFIEGYKAAQSKGQYSLENIKDALNQLADKAEYGISNFAREEIITKIIQSLSTQRFPSEFIPEIDDEVLNPSWGYGSACISKIKTITNTEGKEVLVGVYRY